MFVESHNGVLAYPVAIDIQHEFGQVADADDARMAEMPLRENRKPREREISICWLTEMASYGRESPRRGMGGKCGRSPIGIRVSPTV